MAETGRTARLAVGAVLTGLNGNGGAAAAETGSGDTALAKTTGVSGAETGLIVSDRNGSGQNESDPTANAPTGPIASVLTESGQTVSVPTGATETATAGTAGTGETESGQRTARLTRPWSARSAAAAGAESVSEGEAAAVVASTSGGETAMATSGEQTSSRKTRTAASTKTGPTGDPAVARATTTPGMPTIMAAREGVATAATTARVSRHLPSRRGRKSMPRLPFSGGFVVAASAAVDPSPSSFLACGVFRRRICFCCVLPCLLSKNIHHHSKACPRSLCVFFSFTSF